MRRTALIAAIAVLVPICLAAPAAAKGWDRATVRITGADLSAPIVERGESAWVLLDDLGIGELKWDAPNVGGTLRPGLDVGRPYPVTVRLGCGRSRSSTFAVTLYPEAVGGPQLGIERAQTLCNGMTTEAGWLPLRTDMLRPFFRVGLPRPLAEPSVPTSPVGVVAPPAAASPGLAWILGGLFAILLLGGIVWGLRIRDRP